MRLNRTLRPILDIVLALTFLIPAALIAQQPSSPQQIRFVSVNPTGTCGYSYITRNKTTGLDTTCVNGTWVTGSGGVGPAGPTGPPGIGPVATTVSSSATPTFTVATSGIEVFKITLTAAVTSSTLTVTSATAGQSIDFNICQDSTGGWTFAWPTNVVGAGVIDTTALACSRQIFRFDGTNAQAFSPMTITGNTNGGCVAFPGSSSGSVSACAAAAAGAASAFTMVPGASNSVVPDAGSANNYISAISSAGVISKTRPTCSTLSDAATSCATDATNATNIGSGTLPDARLTSNVPLKNATDVWTGRQDASGAASTAPAKTGTSVPISCTPGDVFFHTATTAGQNLFYCTSPNSFTQQLNTGGAGGASAGATIFSQTNSVTVTAASSTTLIGTVTGSTTIAANTFTAGSLLEVLAQGYYTSTGSRTLTFILKIGGTTQLTTGAVTAPAATTGTWQFRCGVTTRTVGASGTQIGNCILSLTGATLTGSAQAPMQTSSVWTLDTTGTLAIDIQAAWDATTGAPTITSTNAAAWIPGAPVTSVTYNNGSPLTGAVNLTGIEISANKDANSGYAGLDSSGALKLTEFPLNAYYLGGVRLVNPTIVAIYSSHIASGTTDLYTCPSSKRCAFLKMRLYNDGTLLSSEVDLALVKISSVYYELSVNNNILGATSANSPTNALVGYIGEATEIFAVKITTASVVNVAFEIVTFDVTTPLLSTKKVLVSGDNTIYTVTAPVLGVLPLTRGFEFSGTVADATGGYSAPSVNCSNQNATAYTLNLYQVPSGGSAASTNKITNAQSVVNNTLFSSPNLTSMASGDFILANTSTNNSGQFCWVNIMEAR